MDGDAPPQAPRPHIQALAREEPRGMTLMDLCVLVVGSSVVFSIGWRGISPLMAVIHPDWWLGPAAEVVEKAGLALFLVVIARRARYGGLCRPSEFLLIVCGSQILPHLVEGIPGRILSYLYDETTVLPHPLAFAPRMLGYAIWRWSALATSSVLPLLLSGILIAARRRLPGWVKTVLLSITFLLLSFATLERLGEGMERLSKYSGLGEEASDFLALFFYVLPCFLLYGLPGAAALRNRQRRGWTWLEWSGATLALLSLLIIFTDIHIQAIPDLRRDPSTWLRMFMIDGMALASAALSLWLVRRFGPVWSRCLGLGYDGESHSPVA